MAGTGSTSRTKRPHVPSAAPAATVSHAPAPAGNTRRGAPAARPLGRRREPWERSHTGRPTQQVAATNPWQTAPSAPSTAATGRLPATGWPGRPGVVPAPSRRPPRTTAGHPPRAPGRAGTAGSCPRASGAGKRRGSAGARKRNRHMPVMAMSRGTGCPCRGSAPGHRARHTARSRVHSSDTSALEHQFARSGIGFRGHCRTVPPPPPHHPKERGIHDPWPCRAHRGSIHRFAPEAPRTGHSGVM